jgi:hypothetical protein
MKPEIEEYARSFEAHGDRAEYEAARVPSVKKRATRAGEDGADRVP